MRGPLLAIPTLFLALGLAACGGTDDSGGDSAPVASGGGGEEGGAAPIDEEQRLEYTECMRDNGVDMPDPGGSEGGGINIPDDPGTEAALEECTEHLPNGGEPAEVSPEDLENLQVFTECLRDNGLDDMPDPNSDGTLSIPENTDSEEFRDASKECQDEIDGNMPTVTVEKQ